MPLTTLPITPRPSPLLRFGREADGPITLFKLRCAGPGGVIPKDVTQETRLQAYMEVCASLSENLFSQYVYKTLPSRCAPQDVGDG